jgi:methionyl-tRNA synthetase
MPKHVVTSAWPYVNNIPHLGTMIGSLLSGDVFARFLRLMGEDVLYVSGSDEHGTPIEVEARKKGVSPEELVNKMHEYVKKIIKEWNLEYDNYTRTHNSVHIDFVRSFMMDIYNNGYITKKKDVLPYCEYDKIFLPDRFIEGTCPYCGYDKARGDQCENCGRILHPSELINPRCVFCGRRPIYKETEHWFFDLSKTKDKLMSWLERNDKLPSNVRNYTLNWLKEGLKERAVTRDNSWGIPAPFPGAENKTIYVWFDALLGYISAVKEYYLGKGSLGEFEKTWLNPETKTYFFIGKDNIPFHSIIFPAMLIASGKPYPLPYVISATEYLLFQEEKFSKSRGIGVFADEALEILPADYWRFALIKMRPEQRDISFTWAEFYRIVNTELNDDIGNFIHRSLSFLWSRYNGVVPEPGPLGEADSEMVKEIEKTADSVIELMYSVRLKDALNEIVELARKANQYFNQKAPWETFKSNRKDCDTTIYVSVNITRTLAVLLNPFIPSSSRRILAMLNLGDIKPGDYREAGKLAIKPGHRISKPEPIFQKLPQDFLEKVDQIVEEARRKVREKRPKI